MLTGKHLINGEWLGGAQTFASAPASGAPQRFAAGDAGDVARACAAAEDAFASFAASSRARRAAFLDAIAAEIDARGDAISAIAQRETALPEARLIGERGRTTAQLRMFARHIERGDYLDRRHDPALPERQPAPRPDLRLLQRPLGPVAVFGASNFPLAFSVAGGDTASALAAGCPVVVKGHPAHPGTGELVAQAVDAARRACDLHPGVFGFVQGDSHAVGAALVEHPLIQAVGFTGSLGAGRQLFDRCARRPQPIPFFGELGSINPVFVLPQALRARGAQIAAGWVASLTLGVGQFCTNPGIVVVIGDAQAEVFIAAAEPALQAVPPQTMLSAGIAGAYAEGVAQLCAAGLQQRGAAQTAGPRTNGPRAIGPREAAPGLFATSGRQWLANPAWAHEIFGPAGIVIGAADATEALAIAAALPGQLTCTLQMEAGDRELARQLLPVLERKAGRLLANGFPTGVEVCDAMAHGGPYPASTNAGATSVGTLAIRRFLRPVCYQDIPLDLLPGDLLPDDLLPEDPR